MRIFGPIQTLPFPLYTFICISVDPPPPLDVYVINGRPQTEEVCMLYTVSSTEKCHLNAGLRTEVLGFSLKHMTHFFSCQQPSLCNANVRNGSVALSSIWVKGPKWDNNYNIIYICIRIITAYIERFIKAI